MVNRPLHASAGLGHTFYGRLRFRDLPVVAAARAATRSVTRFLSGTGF